MFAGRIAAAAGSFFLIASCASTQSEYVTFQFPPPDEEFYETSYEMSAHRLHLPVIHDGEGLEQASVLVNATFDSSIGVSVIFDHYEMDGEMSENISLHAGIWDYTADEHVDFGGGTYSRSLIENYYAEISREEYDLLVSQFDESGFYDVAFTDAGETFCTDGTTYYVRALTKNKQNLFARHTCDNGFSGLIDHAAPLFDLARKYFPQIAPRLTKAEARIRG